MTWTQIKPLRDILAGIPTFSRSMSKPGIRFECNRYSTRWNGERYTYSRDLLRIDHNGDIYPAKTSRGRESFGNVVTGELSELAKGYDDLPGIVTAIRRDPAAWFAKHGKDHNRCCYCWAELTTAASRSAGYGPECAKRFGLPWG